MAALPDERVIVGSHREINSDNFTGYVSVWHDDRAVRGLKQTHTGEVRVAAVPGGRFVNCSQDCKLKLWTTNGGQEVKLDVDIERNFDVEDWVTSVAALPNGEHLVVGGLRRDRAVQRRRDALLHCFRSWRSPL